MSATRQQFSTLDVARLEVRQPWPGLPNLLANPAPGSVSQVRTLSNWYTIAGTASSLDVVTTGIRLTASAPVAYAYHSLVPITPATGDRIRATVSRTGAGTTGVSSSLRIAFLGADGATVGTVNSSTRTTNGDMTIASTAVPASARFIQFGLLSSASGLHSVTFANAVLVMAQSAPVSAAAMTVEPPWTNVLGPTLDATIERDELSVGTLSATIADAALDPATVDLIRAGRPIRLTVREQATHGPIVWEPIFVGKVQRGEVTYDYRTPGVPESKRARIVLSATDDTSLLANAPRPDGVGTIAELAYVLAGTGVAWNLNGSTAGVDPNNVVVVSHVEQASALDQVAITRDSVLGYAWLDRTGTLQCWDRNTISTVVADTLTESTYTDADIDFATDRLINTVTIKVMILDPATGDTVENNHGPFVDPDSVRKWGAFSAEFSVHGLDEADVPAYAAAILAANATPTKRLTSLTLPMATTDDLSAHARRDLYDLVRVINLRGGIDTTTRVVSVKHRISADNNGGKWLVDLGFAPDGLVASPQVTPSPAETGAQTLAQRLRPLGEVTMWFGTKAAIPAGWLALDGATFDAAAYPNLAALLGSATLPDFTDRLPIGAGTKALGTSGGSPTTVLTPAHLPPHRHTIDHAHNLNVGGSGTNAQRAGTGSGTNAAQSGGPVAPFNGNSGTGPGTNDAVDVMNPWRALWFIIRAL